MPVKESHATLRITHDPIRWKNLVFRKDGTSSYGRMTWDTKDAARKEAEEGDRFMMLRAFFGRPAHIITIDGNIDWNEYSHAEQVPLTQAGLAGMAEAERRKSVEIALADSQMARMPPPTPEEMEILEAFIRGDIKAENLVDAVKAMRATQSPRR